MWSLGQYRNIPAQSCVIMFLKNATYEFKPNTELLKTCVNAMK